jgi:hypothetical protein
MHAFAQIAAPSSGISPWIAAVTFFGGVALTETVKKLFAKAFQPELQPKLISSEFSAEMQIEMRRVMQEIIATTIAPILNNQTDILRTLSNTNQGIQNSLTELVTIHREESRNRQ